MGYVGQAPNMQHVVEEQAARHPREYSEAHFPALGHERATRWVKHLAAHLHFNFDQRWGANGKRGNVGDPSMDALSFKEPGSPAGGVGIYDVIEGAGPGGVHRPAWIDQTQETANRGTIGAFIQPERSWLLGEPVVTDPDVPPVQPPPTDPPPVIGQSALALLLAEIQTMNARLAAVEAANKTILSGMGGIATQCGDGFSRQEVLFGNQTKRLFGTLVEGDPEHPETLHTPAGIAEEAVQRMWDKAAKEPIRARPVLR